MTVSSTASDATLTATSSRPAYPLGVPIKFTPDGAAQRYPGNTTVCHIPATSPLMSGLHLFRDTLTCHPTLGAIFRPVPKESWHMTVMDGVRERECEPGMWPEGLGKKPLDKYTEEFSQSLRQFGLELEKEGLAPPYRMRVIGFGELTVGVGLNVVGATREEEQRLRRLRDRLADTIGVRAPRHDIYEFHITVGYWLRHADGDEDKPELDKLLAEFRPKLEMEFELGAVEFCTFETMCAYPRLFYLGDKTGEIQ